MGTAPAMLMEQLSEPWELEGVVGGILPATSELYSWVHKMACWAKALVTQA